MKFSEFEVWLDGFMDAIDTIDGSPSWHHWMVIKEKLASVTEDDTEKELFTSDPPISSSQKCKIRGKALGFIDGKLDWHDIYACPKDDLKQ